MIVVEAMPKPELLDPAGKATLGAVRRLGHDSIVGVRIGKRFELAVDGPVDDDRLAAIRAVSEELLANPVIEDVVAVYVGGAEDDLDEFTGVAAGETH